LEDFIEKYNHLKEGDIIESESYSIAGKAGKLFIPRIFYVKN